MGNESSVYQQSEYFLRIISTQQSDLYVRLLIIYHVHAIHLMAKLAGNGKYGSFVASVTPNPLIWVGIHDSTLWFGARFSFTNEARILASNVSVHNFSRELKASYILEEPSMSEIPKFVIE